MSDVEILREAVPTVRWRCNDCGHHGLRGVTTITGRASPRRRMRRRFTRASAGEGSRSD